MDDSDSDLDAVDLIVLTRDGRPPPAPVCAAIAGQGPGVRVHVVAGASRPDDVNRWDAITRARNAGRSLGSAPFVMYLDDDVVPAPGCVAALVDGLRRRPGHAALAVDLLGETDPTGFGLPGPHVGMGAVMFRREALAFLRFRWEPGRCECLCCVDDLRAGGLGIDYLPGPLGRHLPELTAAARARGPATAPAPPCPAPSAALPAGSPRVMTAFNREHFARFRRLFLTTFHASGNREQVSAVAYGLTPTEQRALARLPGVEALVLPNNGVNPAIRRLFDFQRVVAGLPPGTPVAHWDAGDVVFQGPLGPLWDLARAFPDQALVVREPIAFFRNETAMEWVLAIDDLGASRDAFLRIARGTYVNGGFAAGTARAFFGYLAETHRIRHSRSMAGSTDWSDQTALNIDFNTRPSRYRLIPDGWNYCLCARDPEDFRVARGGLVVSNDGAPVTVVHGNARTLPWFELSHHAAAGG